MSREDQTSYDRKVNRSTSPPPIFCATETCKHFTSQDRRLAIQLADLSVTLSCSHTTNHNVVGIERIITGYYSRFVQRESRTDYIYTPVEDDSISVTWDDQYIEAPQTM